MRERMKPTLAAAFLIGAATSVLAQTQTGLDWPGIEAETLQHFQSVLRFDTSDPPGNERPAAEYLKKVLESEGIA